ncbi:MAG: translation initiation factor IF-2 [Myxococcales bacterium]
MSSKLRVYEVARDLGMDNKELATLLQSIGFSEIKNHMSVVPPEAIERAKRQLERRNEPSKVVEERIRPTVVKRRAAKRPEDAGAAAHSTGAESSSALEVAAPSHELLQEPTLKAPESRSEGAAVPVTPAASASPHAAAGVRQPEVAQPPRAVAEPTPASAHRVEPESTAERVPERSIEHAAVSTSAEPVAAAPVPQPAGGPAAAQTPAPVAAKAVHKEIPPATPTPAAVEPKPVEAKPVETKPAEAKPIEAKPVEAKPVETRPAEAKPVETKPAEAKPIEAKSGAKPAVITAEPAVSATQPSAREPALADAKPIAAQPRPVESPAVEAQQRPQPVAKPISPPAAAAPMAPKPAATTAPGTRPSSPPRTGIEVWEGRPGVPMSPAHRAPVPRRVQYDAKAGANAAQRRPGQPGGGPGGQRGPMSRGTRGKGPAGMGGPGLGRGGPAGARQAPVAPAPERGAHKRVVKIESSIGLQTLANRMGIKAHELLRKLIMLGMTGVNINSTLDADTAKICASEFGWDVEDVAVSEEQALVIAQGVETDQDSGDRVPRPPVVTVMGHVDHGKTSLLDKIRKANVVAGEAGGITQHIGAYSVETPAGRITFLDTPGHEAFTAMRARGAQTTDVVVLVVAADDGVMPQTKEAVNHAKLAKVPIVVAINKCDKPEAQPDRCRRELSELGLVPEEWGGDTLFAEVSAHTGQGVEALLEKVLLQAEMLALLANPNKPAVGVVLEAQLDRGRGPVATLLITDGTLNRGDVLLAGAASGKVRAMLDSFGRSLAAAGPATPVEVIGLNDVPAAGDPIHVLKDIKKAQEIADSRKTKERRSLMPSAGPRLTLEELYKAMKDTEQLELKVIVKADVHGSVEAVSDALVRLSTDKVKVTVVHAAAGAITEGDVNLAVAAGAIIIGFNVRPAGKAAALAAQEKVEVRHYNIIYNVVDDVKAAMEGLLSPSLVEKALGQAQVRQVFRVSKAGNIAGCMVIQGVIRRSGTVRLMRENAMIWSGKMSSLKRFKDDAREVKEGFDCGIALEGYQDIKEGDIVECFEMEEVRQTL